MPYEPYLEQTGKVPEWTPTSYIRWKMNSGLEQKWVKLFPNEEEWRVVEIVW